MNLIKIANKYEVFVKRDDQISLGKIYPGYCGNKVRKLAFFRKKLLNGEKFEKIISFGGNQSNSMLAISHLCNEFNLKFDYYSRPVSEQAKLESEGNLAFSLKLGMNLIETNSELEKFDF